MRHVLTCTILFAALGAASCGKGKPSNSPPSASAPNASTPESATTNPGPGPSDAAQAPGESAPAPAQAKADETSAELTKRLLEAPFGNPDGVKIIAPNAPVSLDPEVVDLGSMMPGTNGVGSMRLTNVSDQPLRILGLRSTCSCTIPDIQSDTIAPGDSVTIEIELKAGSATGIIERYVMAMFEGYNQPLQMSITADVNYGVRTSVEYDPPDQTRVALITLDAVDPSTPFRVISAGEGGAGTPPVFADGFDPANDAPRARYVIRQDFTAYSPEELPRWFIIETDHPTAAVIDVRVENQEYFPERRRHNFNISEKRLVFGRMTPGEMSERRFRVVGGGLPAPEDFLESLEWTNRDQCDVQFLSVVDDEGGLDVTVGVRPKPDATGVLFGTVTIHAMGDTSEFDIIGRVVPEE